MEISRVISYQNAWETLLNENEEELKDLLNSLDEYYRRQKDKERKDLRRIKPSWALKLEKKGWFELGFVLAKNGLLDLDLKMLEHCKNGIIVTLDLTSINSFHKWLFQQTSLAYKYNLCKIPILLISAKRNSLFISGTTFNECFNQIKPLSPLGLNQPFLVLEFTDQQSLFEIEIFPL